MITQRRINRMQRGKTNRHHTTCMMDLGSTTATSKGAVARLNAAIRAERESMAIINEFGQSVDGRGRPRDYGRYPPKTTKATRAKDGKSLCKIYSKDQIAAYVAANPEILRNK